MFTTILISPILSCIKTKKYQIVCSLWSEDRVYLFRLILKAILYSFHHYEELIQLLEITSIQAQYINVTP